MVKNGHEYELRHEGVGNHFEKGAASHMMLITLDWIVSVFVWIPFLQI